MRDLLRSWAESAPERLAFTFGEQQMTFGELYDRARARAGALQASGVAPGDRVVIAMSAGLPCVEMFWALQLIGAVPCVVNPFVPAQTLARRISIVRPKSVVTDAVAAELVSAGVQPTEPDIRPEDLAFLQLTSGTTGDPRASMILQRNVMHYLRTNRSAEYLTADDVRVSWVPPWHDLGLVRFIIEPLSNGTTCHIVEPAMRSIPQWLETISRVRGTYSAAPDFAFRLAARMVDPASVDLSCLRFMTSGGEPVRWSSVEMFEQRFNLSGVVIPGYGLGEATLSVSEHLPEERVPVDQRGNVSCGTPNPEMEVRAGNSVDRPEEILVRGQSVFAGYFEAPEETARVLRNGWLHTGDSGYLDDGGRLYVLARRSGMIKRAGALIAPRELEEAAQRVAGVKVAAATSVPVAPQGGEVIVVAVERDLAAAQPVAKIEADVSREIVSTLGFAPGRVVVVPRRTIPRTDNGKIRHAQLRALLDVTGAESRTEPSGPAS